MSFRIGVISDTHGLLRPEALTALAGSDHILHAGDVGDSAAGMVGSPGIASVKQTDARSSTAAGVVGSLGIANPNPGSPNPGSPRPASPRPRRTGRGSREAGSLQTASLQTSSRGTGSRETGILQSGSAPSGSPGILEALRKIAPVTAIRGNIDTRGPCAELPATDFVVLAGKLFYLVHSEGWLDLNPSVAGIAAVISGHSHKTSIDTRAGILYLNPGSAGPRRFKLPATVALIEVEDDRLLARIVTL